VQAESGCWKWLGSCSWSGYGRFSSGGKADMAHRVSYELFVGPIPAGLKAVQDKERAEAALAEAENALRLAVDGLRRVEFRFPAGNDECCQICDDEERKHGEDCPVGVAMSAARAFLRRIVGEGEKDDYPLSRGD
jgi:hypothetical protein